MSEKTILISGAFNPLHFGHLLLLKDASNYGKVIVALNSDEWVMKNKGHLLFDFETRKSILEECKYVSKVISFDDSEGDVTYALFEVKTYIFWEWRFCHKFITTKRGITSVWLSWD